MFAALALARPFRLALLIGGALALLAAVAALYSAGSHAGQAAKARKLEPVIASLRTDLAQCQVTVAQQGDALKSQNAAIDELERKGREQTEAANQALRQARTEARQYRAKAERIAHARPGPDQCLSARNLIVESLSEDRR